MKRNQSLEEFTDGRLYEYNDMVKVGTGDCSGCHICCTGMGNSVVLDPYDVYRLQQGLEKTTEALINEGKFELTLVDGCVLPCLSMKTGSESACAFLNSEGRCSIHAYRPGICRLFPLGRVYENGDFKYVLQTNECIKENRTKVKVSKWIESPNDSSYHDFLCKWNKLHLDVEAEVAKDPSGEKAKMLNMVILQYFYFGSFQGDFFEAFSQKEEHFRKLL